MSKLEALKPVVKILITGIYFAVAIVLLGGAFRHNPLDIARDKSVVKPEFVCRAEGDQTCCLAKLAKKQTSLDLNFKLPPGMFTVTTSVMPDSVEHCYVSEESFFGEPNSLIRNSNRFITNPVRSIFVEHSFGLVDKSGHTHAGTDFESEPNEDVKAGVAGTVSVGKTPRGESFVTVHGDGKQGVKDVTYIRLSSVAVSDGDKVEAGKVIAKTGSDDNLHVQVTNPQGKTINPCSVMECQ